MAPNHQAPNGATSNGTGDQTMPIAIIGMSGRFPGDAIDPDHLFNLCAGARDSWSPFPSSRFNQEAFYHPDASRNGASNVKGGHFLREDLALFDAPFFGMTKAEAAALDPQQRLLLECCYEAFENAGTRVEDMAGSDTSVFVGSFCKDWGELTLRDPDATPMYQATGSGQAMLSNRLSYYFNLTGPSVTIDTACSASLVALHLACQSIKSGESRQAVAGGVNVLLNQDLLVTMSSMRFLSPDGRSYTYDSRANGYARGEGVACILLKSLDEALKDGDTIRGIIRSTGINQDGKTNGITLPSAKAQATLIEQVYKAAGLDPKDTQYVETHGTGTQAGDPLEAQALSQTFGVNREDDVIVGSLKTNVGHLEGASGVAGLVKTVMMLERQQILPMAGFQSPNERIPLKEWHLEVPTSLKDWKTTAVRRASINSFGYGGTNAHVIIDEAQGYLHHRGIQGKIRQATSNHASNGTLPPIENEHKSAPPKLFTLSAFDEATGKRQAEDLLSFITQRKWTSESAFLEDLAFTLNDHRSILPWKRAFPASSLAELTDALSKPPKYVHSPKPASIGFIFTGQGAQWYAMGRELLAAYPIFQESLFKSTKYLREFGSPWSAIEELSKSPSNTRVNEAELSQPLCSAIQIALVDLLRDWNILPTAVVGHSSGEIAAAYAAGALDHKSAIACAYFRGQSVASLKSTGSLPSGAMAAVTASEKEVWELLGALKTGQVTIACYNSTSSFTVSGDTSAIDELLDTCNERGNFTRKLLVDVAYHSPHMAAVSDRYRKAISHIKPKENGSATMYSSVTGQQINLVNLGPEYWVENLTSPVRFSEALAAMSTTKSKGRFSGKTAKAPTVLVEIGPHSALAGPVKQTLGADPVSSKIAYFPSLVRNQSAVTSALSLACRLFENGCTPRFSSINGVENSTERTILVDLPKYPFNHQVAYWAEPRESIQYRLRKWPRHDLLGAPVRMPNPLEPRWRNWIRTSELPWVRDHMVQGLVIYPAAGYLAMAIEAAFQRAVAANVEIEGYEMREISIGQAMIIPEASGEVESMLTMRPYAENSRGSSDVWDEFRVFSASDDGTWTEHCRGLISVRPKESPNEVNGKLLQEADSKISSRAKEDMVQTCQEVVDVAKMYENCSKIGLDYGPSFANLVSARRANDRSMGTIVVPDIASTMPANYHSPHVVHPATLDACFHACFPAQGKLTAPIMPTFISKMYVRNDISKTAGSELEVHMKVDKRSLRDVTSSEIVYEKVDGESSLDPVITMSALTTTSLSADNAGSDRDSERKTYFKPYWAADPTFLSSDQLSTMCEHLSPKPGEDDLYKRFDEMGFYIADRALRKVPESFVPKMQSHNQRLYQSVKRLLEDVKNGRLSFDTSAWLKTSEEERDSLWEYVRKSGDEGNFIALVGDNLHRILLEEVDPLSVTMQDDALGKYYANNQRMARQYQQAAVYVDLLAHKNPHLKILEIGSGTGGATFNMLNALGGGDGQSLPRFTSYDVTDITTGFFEKVQEKAVAWGDLINYRKLDIEADIHEQGFELGSYDLVIAANVLHATTSMTKTMGNVRKLMKPGGTVILTELMHKTGGIANLFGIFPGWWVGEEEYRQDSALLTEDRWDSVLRATGFSGVDFAIWDTPNPITHQGSNIITKAVEVSEKILTNGHNGAPANGNHLEDCLIVVEGASETLQGKIQDHLPATARFAPLLHVRPKDQVCIVLSELQSEILPDPTTEQFEAIKDVMLNSKGVIWVTIGAVIEGTLPNAGMISGLMRTLRMELGSTPLITLDLDPKRGSSETGSAIEVILDDSALAAISQVLQQHFNSSHEIALNDQETEYAARNNVVMVSRIIEDKTVGEFVASRTQQAAPELASVMQPGRPLKVEIGTPGLLDSLYWDDDKRMEGEPGPNEVDIEVKASALNFRDVMMSMGQIETHALGCECSGIVAKVGSGVTDLSVGDRVITHADGSFSNFIRAKKSAGGIVAMPEGMDFEAAATLPIIYCTAYHSIRVANLRAGETVLIHAASGGLGQALIMLCRHFGAEIFTTVGTQEKKQFLIDQYEIPEDRIFSSRDASFARCIIRETNGRGVDVVMNSLSGELLRVTWNCIASFGRFVELGKRDFAVNSRLEMAPFARNVSYLAVDLVTLLEEKPEYGQEVWSEVMSLIRNGSVKAPQPISIYEMANLEKALRTMQSGKHMGKLVLVPGDEKTKVMPRPIPITKLRSDATYLLAGGLGGIGRALAVWMVNHGAENIAFLSRSGTAQQAAKDTVEHLQSLGANVKVVACDIGDEAQLERSLADISSTMPPIKGLIQLALVIKNALFANMDLTEEWAPSQRPKIMGTWNLHHRLPKDLDFFIMLSSMVGVFGNQGQAAYGAASAFQDSFANFRNSLGLPATTVDLGMVAGVGYVAEREQLQLNLQSQGFEKISEDECMAIIEAAIVDPFRPHHAGSIMTGVGLTKFSTGEAASRLFYHTPKFSHFRRMALSSNRRQGDEAVGSSAGKIRDLLKDATSMAEATEHVTEAVLSKMSNLLMVPVEDLSPANPMSEYGMDSLVAVEMRNWITRDTEVTVPILELLGNQSIKEVCKNIARQSKLVSRSVVSKEDI
ncbi:hypothetical protein K402DRAFT_461387 [Aulographum hederae CBS 113979]|uniref:Uncharacterized protein n=1 Tax=Aulographum hederae CBS 113979 TaxID=1176131 RepID=A0A6G1H6U8_9PEZI|nr:hypothetical protein K402DRAFT_461387 [Aulographum hederae CBS 113979]